MLTHYTKPQKSRILFCRQSPRVQVCVRAGHTHTHTGWFRLVCLNLSTGTSERRPGTRFEVSPTLPAVSLPERSFSLSEHTDIIILCVHLLAYPPSTNSKPDEGKACCSNPTNQHRILIFCGTPIPTE